MDAGDWIALGAAAGGAAIGLVGLYLGGRHRRADIAIDEARMVRARVWELMKSEPGLRTVLALDERDGKAARRVNYLQRTEPNSMQPGCLSSGTSCAMSSAAAGGPTRTIRHD